MENKPSPDNRGDLIIRHYCDNSPMYVCIRYSLNRKRQLSCNELELLAP